MSTHNIGFYEDLTKIIFELSSNIINLFFLLTQQILKAENSSPWFSNYFQHLNQTMILNILIILHTVIQLFLRQFIFADYRTGLRKNNA